VAHAVGPLAEPIARNRPARATADALQHAIERGRTIFRAAATATLRTGLPTLLGVGRRPVRGSTTTQGATPRRSLRSLLTLLVLLIPLPSSLTLLALLTFPLALRSLFILLFRLTILTLLAVRLWVLSLGARPI